MAPALAQLVAWPSRLLTLNRRELRKFFYQDKLTPIAIYAKMFCCKVASAECTERGTLVTWSFLLVCPLYGPHELRAWNRLLHINTSSMFSKFEQVEAK